MNMNISVSCYKIRKKVQGNYIMKIKTITSKKLMNFLEQYQVYPFYEDTGLFAGSDAPITAYYYLTEQLSSLLERYTI